MVGTMYNQHLAKNSTKIHAKGPLEHALTEMLVFTPCGIETKLCTVLG